MQFIHQWFPLIVTIREGRVDSLELDELNAGFERYFERAEPYAVLNAALPTARTPDAVGRLHLAEWANQDRVRRCSKELCVGSATVVARPWERHALTALQWLWTPPSPHQAVRQVREGLGFCIERLVERGVQLPASAEVFQGDVYRGLAALDIAGLDGAVESAAAAEPLRPSADGPPRAAPASSAGARRMEVFADREGSIVLGWLAPRVLWTCFCGRMSQAICQAYARGLAQLLRAEAGVSYFLDSSALESVDLSARAITLKAVLEHERHFGQVIVSNWAGGLSPATRVTLQALGSTVVVLDDPRDFEARLQRAVPGARQLIDARLMEALELSSSRV